MKFEISIWLFIVSILLSLVVGFFLCGWYITYKMKKILGIKSLKELEKQMKQAKEMEKRMKKGSLNEVLKDPAFQKQMEELKKRFRGGV